MLCVCSLLPAGWGWIPQSSSWLLSSSQESSPNCLSNLMTYKSEGRRGVGPAGPQAESLCLFPARSSILFHPLRSLSLASGDVTSSALVNTACTQTWRQWISCGLPSTEKRLKLVFFRAVSGGAGRGHPDRALRINFTSMSSFDKMFEVWQFSYVLSHWPRTALSWIGKQEQCKSSATWHLPVFWLRERWINKSCQTNALQWPWSDRRDSILEKPIIFWQRYFIP